MALILLTGFDPFDGATRNPSAETVAAVAAEYDGAHELVTATLPVSFSGSAAQLRSLLREHAPDAVIATGLAGGRAQVAVERIGVNLMDARIPDNDGDQPVDGPSDPDGPAALFSTLPAKHLVAVLTAAGIPAVTSLSAGTYVCNHVLYTALSAAAPGTRAGFIHLPWSASTAPDGAPHLADAALVRAVRLVVDHAMDPESPATGGSIW